MLINCGECGKEFNKSTGEYNRSVRLKRGHFCNTKCSAAFGNKKIPRHGNISNFHEHVQSQLNDLSPFRYFVNHAKRRNDERPKSRRGPKRELNITPRYLLTILESQNGCCPLTGWKLTLPYSSAGQFDGPAKQRASLDRIDNNLGYIEGNVRFVAQIANLARNKYSDDDVITFCEAVVKHKGQMGVLTG